MGHNQVLVLHLIFNQRLQLMTMTTHLECLTLSGERLTKNRGASTDEGAKVHSPDDLSNIRPRSGQRGRGRGPVAYWQTRWIEMCNEMLTNTYTKPCSQCAKWTIGDFFHVSRKYMVVRNRYSRLLFTSGECIFANLRAQEQSTNMKS